MSAIPQSYQAQEVEQFWAKQWENQEAFKVKLDKSKEPYSMLLPPPNVTGVLHLGHVLNTTLQDILARRARCMGKCVAWICGTDHAGIATQIQVERLLKKEGTSRQKLGREGFIQRAGAWRDEHREVIFQQLKALGASLDPERSVHTLDPLYQKAVLTAFIKLFKKGLIYRGKRMVNWCVASQTALSDEEVIPTARPSTLYYLKYPLVGEKAESLEVATTRPETIMGDVALAVHPQDPRYTRFIGRQAQRPFPPASLPIIADEAVEKDFGTGVLKITPSHDKLDFDIGSRHALEGLEVIDEQGKINCPACPQLHNLDRFKAREEAVKLLKASGLLLKEEPHESEVGLSERAGVVVEPRLCQQWWLRYPQVDRAREAVEKGHLKLYPPHWEKVYLHWLGQLEHWCLSRQLWWGHRVPVWYHKNVDKASLSEADLHCPEKVHVSLEGPSDPENWEQEEDVLDTWASSWLWPFAVWNWPDFEKGREDFDFFYPSAVLVTGFDILFFWVSRMVMAALELLEGSGLTFPNTLPFKAVYFNNLIRDTQGRKLSKSLGNSPEVMPLVKRLGADALRLGLLSMAPTGRDIHFSEAGLQRGRHFCNKLWNACRFRQLQGAVPELSSSEEFLEGLNAGQLDALDTHMLAKLCSVSQVYPKLFDTYNFHALTGELYTFFWKEFCDWYLEVAKYRLKDPRRQTCVLRVLDICLRQLLLLLHPFIPFITEELLHRFGWVKEGQFAMNMPLETGEELEKALKKVGLVFDKQAMEEVGKFRSLISCLHRAKAEKGLAAHRQLEVLCVPKSPSLSHYTGLLKHLGGFSTLRLLDSLPGVPDLLSPWGDFSLGEPRALNLKRLRKELTQLEKHIAQARARLANEQFLAQAPKEFINAVRERLKENAAKKADLERLAKAQGGFPADKNDCP